MKKSLLFIITVFTVFSSLAQDTQAPTAPSNLYLITFTNTSITVVWDGSTDNVGVTEYEIYLNDALYDTVAFDPMSPSQQSVGYTNLTSGNYCFKVLAKDAAGNMSGFSNEECQVVYDPIDMVPPSEVYLSGLLNYSGDNKAIEISNVTEFPIDISGYELRVSYDGSGTWDATYTIPVNTFLNPYDTYIVANSNIAICTTPIEAYDNSITSFDGNDTIGLFNNNVYVDAIGQLGSTNMYVSTGVFMKRLFVINGIPSTTFEINEWLPENDDGSCPAGFGFAEFNLLSTEDNALNSFQIYPNPTNGDVVYIQTKDNTEISTIRIYDISGKLVIQQANPSREINVQKLQQGMYILQLEIGNQIVTKKLIKQ